MSSPWLYEVRDLWMSYSNGTKKVEVLRGINFCVRSGETVAVTGPSGVGKEYISSYTGSPGQTG